MKLKLILVLIVSHLVVGFAGFALGIYTLPILSAPPSPSVAEIKTMSQQTLYRTEFVRDLADSDTLHWGEGEVFISEANVAFVGELAPGPAYELYFSPEFVETEADFKRLKSTMVAAGSIDTFDNFVVEFKGEIELKNYNSVIVWCEAFGEFITAAKYR